MKQRRGFPWWMLFIFTCFLTWLSVFIAGVSVRNRKWIIIGLAYSIPMFLMFSVSDSEPMANEKSRVKHHLDANLPLSAADTQKYAYSVELHNSIIEQNNLLKTIQKEKNQGYRREITDIKKNKKELLDEFYESIEDANPDIKNTPWKDFVMGLWVISVLAAFGHAVAIRKRYWQLYNMQNNPNYRTKVKRKIPKSQEQNYREETEKIRSHIEAEIEQSNKFDSIIVDDIRQLTKQYSTQVKNLTVDRAELKTLLANADTNELANEVTSLKAKLAKESSPRLEREYKETIRTKETLLKSYKAMQEQKQSVELRLEKALDSLKQIKYDLNRLKEAFSREQQTEFFTNLKNKAEDLKTYTDELETQIRKNRH
ncbi:MAG: hypothetical protein U9N85_01755 [Bacteroidota bacterium]|nr:hypothetical protein [Bacteroidota bacterium]